MNTQYALLGLLQVKPDYGYSLKKQHDTYFGQTKVVHVAQVYATLSRLQQQGKVDQVAQDQQKSGGPQRIKYAITHEGRQDLLSWLSRPEAPAATLQPQMYLKVLLTILIGQDASTYLQNQSKLHIAHMRQLTTQRRQAKLSQQIQIDHQLFHLEADLRWIDLTTTKLQSIKEQLCLSQF